MKHLNNYKIFENKEDIDVICRRYNINNYTINDDGSIDVDGDVYLRHSGLNKLPIKFNRVNGNFHCDNNILTSLEGSPKYLSGAFYCRANKLTSLEGSPKYVGGSFVCFDNNLVSLEGCSEFIGTYLSCENNPIHSIVSWFSYNYNVSDLIELFNYYDIVQGMNVIYDRLKFFYEGIDVEVTNKMLRDIESNGYKIIY